MGRCFSTLCLVLGLGSVAAGIGLGSATDIVSVDACDSVFPQWQGHWTGFVRFDGTSYAKQSTSTATISSRNLVNAVERGWAKFDLSVIPDDAVIVSAALRYSASQLQPYGAGVVPRLLAVDPVVENSGAVLMQQITTGPEMAEPLPIPYQAVPIWVLQQLNSAAVAAIQGRLAADWIAFGFDETSEDPDYGGQFYGWNSSSRRPRLIVTYYLPVDVRVLACSTSSYPLVAGQDETIWARIANLGTNVAHSVRVTGLVDNVPFDSVLLSQVGPGVETTVVFNYRYGGTLPGPRSFAAAVRNSGEPARPNDTARFDDWLFPAGTYFAEGFDRTTASLPNGWVARSNDGGNYLWTRSSGSQAHTGASFARCIFETTLPNDDWLISPPLVLAAGFVDSVGLFVRTAGVSPVDTLELWVMSGQNIADTVARLRRVVVGSTSYLELGASLEWHSGTTIHLGLRKRGISLNQLIVDDIWVMRQTGQDVGVTTVVQPAGTIYQGRVVQPEMVIRNFGVYSATFGLRVVIRRQGVVVYDTTETGIPLAAGASLVRTLAASWTPTATGEYSVTARTVLDQDQNPTNDSATATVTVLSVPAGGWEELSSLTAEPSAKMVKDGAWLVACPGRILAAKGNRTPDFYSFDLSSGRWQLRTAVPAGEKGRAFFGKGATACFDGQNAVYAIKGGNTQEFWRYDIAGDSWLRLRDVPAYTSKGKIKAGADIVCVGTGGAARLYLMKGPSAEFLRYLPEHDSWEPLPGAPNPSVRWNDGSFLVYDGNRTIYAHKPRIHELWRYDVVGEAWSSQPLAGMPYTGPSGESRKAKDGSAGTWLDGAIYALKGGNTTECWRYETWHNAWVALEPIPAIGRDGRRKTVKAGADIVAAQGRIYVLKGNKSLEFWAYRQPGSLRTGPTANEPRSQQSELRLGEMAGELVPILTDGRLKLQFELGAPREADIRLYDAAGRSVLHQSPGPADGTVVMDLRRLPSGVYLLCLETRDKRIVRRVTISR